MPDETPILRRAARVVLIDDERVLLLRCTSDDGDIWLTPGGVAMEGETFEKAALRNLRDETGVGDVDLGPCVWLRTFLYRWDDKVFKQQERYFAVQVEGVQITSEYWDEIRRKVFAGYKWWSLDEIQDADAFFAPPSLHLLLPPILAGDYPEEPIALGH